MTWLPYGPSIRRNGTRFPISATFSMPTAMVSRRSATITASAAARTWLLLWASHMSGRGPWPLTVSRSRACRAAGVIVDLAGQYGRTPRNVGYDDLMRVIEADDITIEKGDIVCLHTGFDEVLMEFGGCPPSREKLHDVCCALNGRDGRLLKWITDSGLAALVSDTFAVERPGLPPEGDSTSFIPLHEHCLFKIGVPLGELWYLTELKSWLKKRGRYRFLLSAPPLRLPTAVGSPVTPIATA